MCSSSGSYICVCKYRNNFVIKRAMQKISFLSVSKGHFIKLLCNFFEIAFRHGCSPVNLLYVFRASSQKSSSGGLRLFSCTPSLFFSLYVSHFFIKEQIFKLILHEWILLLIAPKLNGSPFFVNFPALLQWTNFFEHLNINELKSVFFFFFFNDRAKCLFLYSEIYCNNKFKCWKDITNYFQQVSAKSVIKMVFRGQNHSDVWWNSS